jgi:CubicO group peptidase (beta-lactamase class C family)
VNHGFLTHDWTRLCDEITHRDRALGSTHALVVQHRGAVVHEWYGDGYDETSTLISWSIAKSITHALVGIAVGDSLLSLDDTHLRPEWDDDLRSRISLDHLLQMTSGLAWIEDYIDGEVSDVITMLFGDSEFAGDHAGFAASKRCMSEPGSQWLYSSGTSNIVAWVLARALGANNSDSSVITDFMSQRLFTPLGMHSAVPKCDAAGTFVGSSYVYATARDFVRFGELYLRDGVVDECRILPTGWVDAAREVTAYDPDMGMSYGRHWWMWPTDPSSLIAHGYLGQILWVSPHRELVVAHLGNTDAAHGATLRSMVARLVEAFPQTTASIGHDGNNAEK